MHPACDGSRMLQTSSCASVYCSVATIIAPKRPEQKAAQQNQPALQECSLHVKDNALYAASCFTDVDPLSHTSKAQCALQPYELSSGGSHELISYHSYSHMLMMLHACHQHCHTARAKLHIRLTISIKMMLFETLSSEKFEHWSLLADSHWELACRRGIMRIALQQMQSHGQGSDTCQQQLQMLCSSSERARTLPFPAQGRTANERQCILQSKVQLLC